MDFDAFYAGSYRRIVGQVYAVTGDLSAAEDAVAEAYARAWQRWSVVSAHEVPDAWVRKVAVRLAVSSWRKTRNRLLAHARAAVPESAPDLGPDRVVFVDALRKIPVKQRQAMVLYYIADRSVTDIAVEMGVAEGTVKSWLSRGRQRLGAEVLGTSSTLKGASNSER